MKKIFSFLLAFSLVQFVFAQEETKSPKIPIGGRPNIPADLRVEFGFNLLNNRPEDMSTRFFASKTFNIYYQYPLAIFGAGSGFTLSPGVGIGSDKMAFKDHVTLVSDPSKGPESSELVELTEIYGDNITISKNTFAANYVDIPLDLTYHINTANYNKGFRVSVGGKVGWLYNAHSKVKVKDADGLEQKVKNAQDYGLEKIRYGLTFKAGTPGFYVWSYFGLNNVFKENMGPVENQAKQINFGVAVNLF